MALLLHMQKKKHDADQMIINIHRISEHSGMKFYEKKVYIVMINLFSLQ